MRKQTLLAAAAALTAALAVAAPAFAQTAPAPAPQAAPAPAVESTDSPEELAFKAKADAFGDRMKGMYEEMQAAVTAAAGDAGKQKTALDAIQARYQPEADTFATDFQSFMQTELAAVPEAERTEAMAQVEQAIPQFRSLPSMLRAEAEKPQPAAAQ
ncbi:hypothetical protein [Brevundimonas goettingensis]|uniref:Translation initiation factor IF-2 n=1 Tax=Brevundimonas goettingensis TaxID=2774190 RepID=A0A975GW32_9CAUL|nr:hypothetical protein [Brevundimonas goettingensis]QTC91343.1 hypothetical protein IFJ75_19475 [Brevundimonas goettingensis]